MTTVVGATSTVELHGFVFVFPKIDMGPIAIAKRGRVTTTFTTGYIEGHRTHFCIEVIEELCDNFSVKGVLRKRQM